MSRATWWVAVAALVAAGCANGGGGGSPDAGQGGGLGSWGDGGGSACFPGEHLCAGECVGDRPNDPGLGCREGCGEPCEAPEGAVATCGLDGRCDFQCEAPLARVGGRCECVPLDCEDAEVACGAADDGCGGTLDCGACEPTSGCFDEGEDNDVQALAFGLGTLTDRPRTDLVFDAHSLQSATDVDWYQARVIDAFGDGNPTITVTLADAAPGYRLGAWYTCDSGGDATTCRVGTPDPTAGRGCVAATDATGATTLTLQTSCAGTNESGTLLVRVLADTPITPCTPYTLSLTAD